ncbi:hypothetical protein CcaverHIS002_0108810 [Cutaneotrichosporon cavernicola]|nr:hypothetical protein CcaverHIS002_0108810 [Cutaneotrichosporon cavernicola]
MVHRSGQAQSYLRFSVQSNPPQSLQRPFDKPHHGPSSGSNGTDPPTLKYSADSSFNHTMFSTSTLTVLAALAAVVTPVFGHMEMGYNSVIGTDAGKSVATWAPGSTQTVSIGGTAVHGGGSCQLLLSFDGGHSFKVIQSVLGECPTTQTWDFTVPNDVPSGDAVFAWTWFNRLGNREMYMNCASVTISGGGGGGNQWRRDEDVYTNSTRRGVSFNSAPGPFLANIGNGCGTEEGGDVDFPNPGSEVLRRGGFSPRAPTGSCAGGSGPSKPEPSSAAPESSSAAPEPSSPSSNGGDWNQPSATNGGEWSQSSSAPAESSSSASFDDGKWHPSSSSAAPSPTISTPEWGNLHNNGTFTSTDSAAASPSPTKVKCNRKRRVRRHKKRMSHGQVGTF